MNTIPLHPKLVHLPIALAILMPLLTSGVLLAWWRGWLAKRVWIMVVAAQLLLVGSGWVAMRAGESDGERIERLVPEQALEAHEEAAETFLLGGVLGLVISVIPLFLRRRGSLATMGATAISTLVVLVLGYQVGEAGGALVYRHGAAAALTSGAMQPQAERLPMQDGDSDDR